MKMIAIMVRPMMMGMADTQNEAEVAVKELGLEDIAEFIEFEYNDAPMTAEGAETQEKIHKLLENTRGFKVDPSPEFYEMHIDQRLQLVYDTLIELSEDTEVPVKSLD